MSMELLLSELVHLLVTFGIVLILFVRFRDVRLFLAGLFFGFLIDLDHFFDFFLYYGQNFKSLDFLNILNVSDYICSSNHAFVLLHGWEFVPLFWLLARLVNKKLKIKGLEWAVALTYLGHLLVDNFSFSHHLFAYSFFFRLINNFSLEAFDGR